MPEATFAEAISACQTVDDVWHCWAEWPDPSESNALTVSRHVRVWDMGLVWNLVVSEGGTSAMENPTWPSWGDTFVAERLARVLVDRSSPRIDHAIRVLGDLVAAGRITQEATAFQILIGALDGRSRNLTERLRCIVMILARDPELSPEVFEHLFTVVRRGEAFDRHEIAGLLRSKYMSDAHWAAMIEKPWYITRLIHVFDSISLPRLPGPIGKYLLEQIANVRGADREMAAWSLLNDPGVAADTDAVIRIAHLAPLIVASWANPETWPTLPEEAREEIWRSAAEANNTGDIMSPLLYRLSTLEPERAMTLRPARPPRRAR